MSVPHIPGALLRSINRTLAPLDRIGLPPGGDESAPLFVIGLPRSGTTLIYELLVQGFDLAYLTRFFSYTFGIPNLTLRLTTRFTRAPRPRYRSRRGRIPGLFSPAENSVLWERWFPDDPVLGHYLVPDALGAATTSDARATISAMTAIAGRNFAFKNVYLTVALSALLKVFERARLVIVRRPVDVTAASILVAHRDAGSPDWWSVRPPFYREWIARQPVDRVAFQCIRSNQLLNRALHDCPPDRCIEVEYADVCNAPMEFIDRVARWAGGTLRRRNSACIPDRFERSPGPQFESGVRRRFEHLAAALDADCAAYLDRVDTAARGLAV